MVWFKVDDNLAFHHKAMAAGNPAIGMWARAGSFCAQQLTDGFVPDHMVPTLGSKILATKLVTAGLWHRVKGGYQFHEWEQYQPTKAEVEKKRAEARDRMDRVRENKRVGSQTVRANAERTSRSVTPTPTRPDPTHAAAAASGAAGSGEALPGDVQILRSKLGAYTALANLRYDISAEHIAELQELIHLHGDDRLVAVALKTCKSIPPIYVSGFLGTWRTMPEQGTSVAAVAEPRCTGCGKTRRAHDAAEKIVPADDRHEFQVTAA